MKDVIVHHVNGNSYYHKIYAFIVLAITIVFESMGAVMLRHARDNDPAWYVLAYVMYAISLIVFPITLEYLPLCVAYSIWAAVGCALTMICGNIFFGEVVTCYRILGTIMIISGVFFIAY